MEKILIIEDEDFLRDILKRYLEKEGYEVVEASSGEIGVKKFYEDNFSLILLDVMLPGIQGWEVCKEIKKISDTPIIMLTALSDEDDEVKGLELGVEDYIGKPFKPKVLVARVNSLIKRKRISSLEKIGNLVIDRENYKVLKNGKELNLGNKGFALLMYFILNKDLVLTREKILNNIWTLDFEVDERVVDTQIKILRKKIGEGYIKTIRGVGYKFQEVENEKDIV
ncbi:response regulator transcription factor [Cetobacterium somerae]|uniref:response regulator transcription factor n=3 Tax=Fusobacteriaceae TaxID=203492 RepID=UPI001F05FC27|nr:MULTISPECIES: response regulator transcription factor [Cetobacterium]MCX3067789.1 response regulator transcription factor [Cetobacterium somerae]UPO98952.1 response regulator transcription factor [Cetobacterium somerae]